MNAAGLFLTIACTVQYSINSTRSLLLSVDRQLTFSQLPEGYTRYDHEIFLSESLAFQRTKLPLPVDKTTIITTDYAINTMDGSPTVRPTIITTSKPSVQPSEVPSSQPSSCPSTAPSVSPQPSSHPSSSGPTNTYKPTVKPTIPPTDTPSCILTQLPTTTPTIAPTARPTTQPSRHPSAQPSVSPTANPTRARAPQCKPTTKPTATPSIQVTQTHSLVNVTTNNLSANKTQRTSESALFILLYVLGGLAGLWCIHRVFLCYLHTAAEYTRKRKLRAHRNATILSLTPCLSQEKNTNAVKNDSNTGANIASIGAPAASGVAARGAFADSPLITTAGAYANGPVVHSAVLGADISNHVKKVPSGKSSRVSSASVVLSSLHSSEMSDISYSVHSDDPDLMEYYTKLQQCKSEENAMEEGDNNAKSDSSNNSDSSGEYESSTSNG